MKGIKKKQRVNLVIIAFLCIIFPTMTGMAKEETAVLEADFSYQLQFPDNQLDQELGYYHLKMAPNDKQEVSIVVTNHREEPLEIELSVNGAKTNENGVVEYGETDIKNDASLRIDFTELVTGPTEIKLAKNETKKIVLTINMPKESFDGQIAGGIQLKKRDVDDQTKEPGIQVRNKYVYLIPMVLQETDTKLTPQLKLNAITLDLVKGPPAIYTNISNTQAMYMNDVKINVAISEKGKSDVLYRKEQENIKMAPNSFIAMPIPLENRRIEPGRYIAKIQVQSKQGDVEWEKEFDISNNEAKEYEKIQKILAKGQRSNVMSLEILFLLLLLLITIGLFFSKQRKHQHKKGRKIKKKVGMK